MRIGGRVDHREFRVPEAVETLGAQLPAHPGLLAAAEGARIVVEQRRVDPHHPGLQLLHRAHGFVEIGGVDGRAEGIAGAIGENDGLVEARDPANRGHGTERFLVHDLGVRRHVDENRRIDEPAPFQVRRAAAAGGHLEPLLAGALQEAEVAVQFAFGSERAHVDLPESIADSHLLRVPDQLVDEFVVHRLVHVEALRGRAHLAAVEVGPEGRAPRRRVDGRRGHHDERIVARGFDQAALVQARAGLRHGAARLDPPGEGDHVGVRVLDQRASHAAAAGEHLDQAAGKPGL